MSDATPGPEVLLVTYEPLDLGRLIAAVADQRSGAVATFLGTVRSPNEGHVVRWIDYEGYEAMIDAELGRIALGVRRDHGVLGLALAHRLGRCSPGEASIAIVATSPHREAAFEACRAALTRCKARLPIWKHEVSEAGARWIEDHTVPEARLG